MNNTATFPKLTPATHHHLYINALARITLHSRRVLECQPKDGAAPATTEDAENMRVAFTEFALSVLLLLKVIQAKPANLDVPKL